MTEAFKDHFSERAARYAEFRPRYPARLFAFLADLVERHDQAWDAGTGNGQAATGLADYFEHIRATDPSDEQIRNAEAHPRVTYAVGREADSGLPDASCDLVTAAQALHWFDAPRFFAEARRVLQPGGAIAIWTYGGPHLEVLSLDRQLQTYLDHIDAYWPPERRMVDDGYRSIDFPFDELAAPPFTMEMAVERAGLTGYLRTTSAHQRYVAEHDLDPVDWLQAQLKEEWPDGARRIVSWPVTMRAGRAGDTFGG